MTTALIGLLGVVVGVLLGGGVQVGVAWLERQFVELATRGVEVTVRRNVPASPAQHSPHAA